MEGRLHIDGADLRYTDEGHGDPVLLIHQAGADSTTWGDVRKHLLRDHRVITYDRRGFSGSVFAGAPTLSRHAQDAIALLEHLQAAPATVAGTSVGATIALQMALERPDVVRTMVLYELPFHSKRYPDLGAARTFMRVARLAKRGEAEEAAELFLRWAYRYPEGGTAFDRMPKSWREVARRNAIASLNDLQIATAENTIPTRLVRKTIVPAVCLVGDKSPRPMHAFVRRLTKALPNARAAPSSDRRTPSRSTSPLRSRLRFMPPRRHRALKPAQGDVFADSFMTRTTRLPGRLLARALPGRGAPPTRIPRVAAGRVGSRVRAQSQRHPPPGPGLRRNLGRGLSIRLRHLRPVLPLLGLPPSRPRRRPKRVLLLPPGFNRQMSKAGQLQTSDPQATAHVWAKIG